MHTFLRSRPVPYLACLISLTLAACGGDGSPSSDSSSSTNNSSSTTPSTRLTGTAATGSPVNGSVVVIDAAGKIAAAVPTVASTGAFTVDVAGLTAPYLLQVVGMAGGKQVYLSSVATAAGQTVNLTPLTDLVVSAAAGVAGGASLVEACAGSTSTAPTACTDALKAATSGSRLSAAVSSIASLVASLNTAGTDVLTGAFTADGTGFDALLDKILVTPATSGHPVATVTLIATNTTIGQVTLPASSAGNATVTATPPSSDALKAADAVATVLPQVRACLASLSALYPSSNFSAPSSAQVSPFIDDGFNLGAIDKAAIVAALTSNSDQFVAGFSLSATSLGPADFARFSSSEVAALAGGSAPAAVLAARSGGGASVTLDSSGSPTLAWVNLSVSGGTTESPWKFVKGSAYSGCAGGWRLAGSQHADMHMSARISRSSGSVSSAVVITRTRAFHLNTETVDAWSTALGTGTVTQVTVHGPGLAVYSGNSASPVGTAKALTLSRPTGLRTWYAVGDGNTWYGSAEALQSCQDLSGTSAPAGTPCVDEGLVVPGAVYGWVLQAGNSLVAAFPYEVTAVPLSKTFAQANQANLFATITSVTPSSLAAGYAAIVNHTGSVLDGVFSIAYTQGSAYGSKADNCNLALSDSSGSLLLSAEVNAVGHETGCTFNTGELNSGSLARPANPSAITSGWMSVSTTVLGNQAGSGQSLP